MLKYIINNTSAVYKISVQFMVNIAKSNRKNHLICYKTKLE